MSEIIWTRPAVADVQRLIEFLKGQNPDAAQSAAHRIRSAADSLATTPYLGKPMEDDSGRRELSAPFGKRGYVLRYRLEADGTVVILRVWHYREQGDC